MNITALAPQNAFTEALVNSLRQRLPDDTLASVQPKSPLPPDTEILLAMGPVTADTIRALPKLTLIQTASDGYETVDQNAATDAGIYVSFSPGGPSGNADSVAEFAVLLLLTTIRQIPEALRSIHDPAVPKPMLSPSLIGKSVCIVGLGAIGQRIADRLRPFGVHISAVDRHPEHAPKDIPTSPDLKLGIAHADAVLLCVRASAENKHMIDAAVLAAMKPGSILINIARGSLIDEGALLAALNSGHLAGAGLDVLESEPPKPTDPLVQHSKTFITPHIAGFTDHTLEGTLAYLTEVIADYKQGKAPKSLLNKPAKPRRPLS